MTNSEFSVEFDILYNNISSNQAPGLTEYEKSVLLTQAQEDIVREIYTGHSSSDSFESTEEVSEYINILVKQQTFTMLNDDAGITSNSKFCSIPKDLWFITYESAVIADDNFCNGVREVIVKPTTQDSFFTSHKNPFRQENDRRVLRLLQGGRIELISKYPIRSYLLRYLSKPNPIILEDLKEGFTINNESTKRECELNPALHRAILNRAVQTAKALYVAGS